MRAKLSKIFDSNSSTKQKKKDYLDAKKADKKAEKRALKSGGRSGGGDDDDEGNGGSYGNESIPNSVATTAKGRAAELRLERRAQGLGEEEEAYNNSSKKNRYGSDERMPAKPMVHVLPFLCHKLVQKFEVYILDSISFYLYSSSPATS